MSSTIPRAGATLIQKPMRQGTRVTRGVDLSAQFSIVGDTIESIVSVTVTRVDGTDIGDDDLTVTPEGYRPPWIGPNAKNVPNVLVGWWQACGPSIAVPYDIAYSIAVLALTVESELIGADVIQVVTSALGLGTVPVIGPTPPALGGPLQLLGGGPLQLLGGGDLLLIGT